MEIAVGFYEAGDFAHAWAAPGGPKIEDDQLPLVIAGEFDVIAIHGHTDEGDGVLSLGEIGGNWNLGNEFGGFDDVECPALGHAGEPPGCAFDVEWFGGVELFALVELVVAVDVNK